MEHILRRVFTERASKDLFGAGPERALADYRRFRFEGSEPALLLECPLAGPPGYDVIVGSYGEARNCPGRLPEQSPPVCRTALEWAASWKGAKPVDVFFEADASRSDTELTAVQCRYKGQRDAPDAFFKALGEAWRSPLFDAVVEKLPAGWIPQITGLFMGRPGAPTRLELCLAKEAHERAAGDAKYLRGAFDALGFRAYDEAMLEEIVYLISISPLCTLQFDMLSDGTLSGTFSLASCLERTGPDFSRLFRAGGLVERLCSAYMRAGTADDRWRLAEETLFADKRIVISGDDIRSVTEVSLPNFTKAKWREARPQPATLYLLLGVKSLPQARKI